MNQYKKKRLKVLGRINHNNKYRYPRNPSLSYPSLEEGGGLNYQRVVPFSVNFLRKNKFLSKWK